MGAGGLIFTSSEDDPRPTPPDRPPDEMCCGRGCSPCVFDYYEEAMQRYETALRQWLERHPGINP